MGLNARQERFCQGYVKTGNLSEAMKRAGYKEKYCATNSDKLLKNTNIQARIKELSDEIRNQNIADATEMQEVLTTIIRQRLKEEVIVVEGCGDGVSEAVTKTKTASLKDVISAVDKLARMQGCYNDRVQMDVVVPVFDGEGDLND